MDQFHIIFGRMFDFFEIKTGNSLKFSENYPHIELSRSENTVQPQLLAAIARGRYELSRSENTVQPQQIQAQEAGARELSRSENTVQPQQAMRCYDLCTSLADQKTRSSRNGQQAHKRSNNSLADQKTRSSRNL